MLTPFSPQDFTQYARRVSRDSNSPSMNGSFSFAHPLSIRSNSSYNTTYTNGYDDYNHTPCPSTPSNPSLTHSATGNNDVFALHTQFSVNLHGVQQNLTPTFLADVHNYPQLPSPTHNIHPHTDGLIYSPELSRDTPSLDSTLGTSTDLCNQTIVSVATSEKEMSALRYVIKLYCIFSLINSIIWISVI